MSKSKKEIKQLPVGSLCVIAEAKGEARNKIYKVVKHLSKAKKYTHIYASNTNVVTTTQIINVASFGMSSEKHSKCIKLYVASNRLKPVSVRALCEILRDLQAIVNELVGVQTLKI